MRLNHRTAIVTGASMGIGAATAVSLAQRGVTVWAVARNHERLEALAAKHGLIRPLVADVSIEEDRRRIVATTGPVDILVNNAGLGTFGLIETMPAEDVRYMFELNVIGLIDLTQRVILGMLERRSGHVCNIGSVVSYMAAPPLSVYAATKFAVNGFTDGLRREVLNRGVGVSLIQPGPVQTGFWDRGMSGDRLDVADKSGGGIPAQWVASAIVKAIRFDRVPGYATIAVPRPIGLGRLTDLPLLSYVLDMASALKGRKAMEPMMVEALPKVEPLKGDAEVIPLNRSKDGDEADS